MPRKRKIDESETLDELLARVQRKHGTRALSLAGDVEELYTVSFLPTGIAQVDLILGGGFPRGHISEIYGAWSAGKSYLMLCTIAETQRNGGTAALIDTEVSFSPGLARAVGVDLDRLLLSTPEFGEGALDLVVDLIRQEIDLVVLDSATSLASRDELSKQVEVAGYAPTVRLWNAGLTRIKPNLAFKPTAFVFLNQVRDNVGVMYGPQTVEPLGHKSKHEAILRLEVRRKEWIKRQDQKVGQVTLLRVAKAKYDGCQPFAETTIDILYEDLRSNTDNG